MMADELYTVCGWDDKDGTHVVLTFRGTAPEAALGADAPDGSFTTWKVTCLAKSLDEAMQLAIFLAGETGPPRVNEA